MYPTQTNRANTARTSRALATRIRILRALRVRFGRRLDLEVVEQDRVQVEDGVEVAAVVAVSIAQQVGVDQVEHDLADIISLVNAPQAEDNTGHPAELPAGQVGH